ncbi:hypothetical protein [Dokdonia sp. Dokd-P16]|uniref:hypothetical protein n=1 Tax=Dokdonia sp. Dokd-P16 TaxID=2173169 RepID=UPI0013A56591|nr:hypothetical protein [Dokdonia sp. Dokd-P16]
MKTTLRHISAFILVALCSIAMSAMDTSFVNLSDNTTTSSSTEKVTAAVSATIVGELPQSEVVIETPSTMSTPSLKNFVSSCGNLSHTTDVLASSTYAQYTKTSINVLIYHRKTDHIFPFHYFW